MPVLINIEFAHSPYWIPLCLLVGIVAAIMLYSSKKHFPELSSWKRLIMAVLRATVVSLLLLLILNPLIKQVKTHIERRSVVFLQDNSQSISEVIPTSEMADLNDQYNALLGDMSVALDTHKLYFSDIVSDYSSNNYNGKLTNISKALEYVWEQFEADHLAAVILASDGLYNEGRNPIYAEAPLEVPLHAIALGDTTANKDLEIKRVFHNRVVYKEDAFEVEVDVTASAFKGVNKTLVLSKKESGGYKKLISKPLRIDKDEFFNTVKFQLPADQAGLITYRLSIAPDASELNKSNNYRSFSVEVLESRQKILIVAAGIHPDIEAMRSILTGLKTFEVDIAYLKNFDKQLKEYNLVILHDLPVKEGSQTYLQDIRSAKLPVLYVLGDKADIRMLSKQEDMININPTAGQFNEVTAVVDGSFNLFTLDDELTKFVPSLPPLRVPFGDFRLNPRYQNLFIQQIKGVETKYPLVSLGEANGTKRGIICGTGIWRWKMFDFLQNENFELSEQLLSKIVNYLAVQSDRRRFRTYNAKRIYNENEDIRLNAELYNASYELINDPEVELELINESGDRSTFAFSKSERAYNLNLGLMPPGDYRYSASVTQAGKRFDSGGSFSIQPLELETNRLRADHAMLKTLTEKHNSSVFGVNQLEQLKEAVMSTDRIKPLYVSDQRRSSVLNIPYLLGFLLLFLCLEWFLRKLFGSY
jgi:hypothetical protein